MTLDLPLVNNSRELWSHATGYYAGYQIFDPETGALIEEGPRVPLASPVAPGKTGSVPVEVVFPNEPGGYRVFVSLLREDTGWLYRQEEQRFLCVDADVSAEGAAVRNSEFITLSVLASRARFQAVSHAVISPFRSIWTNRSLIRTLVQRDVLSRYRGSFGGVLWTLLNPLLLMITYFFVFGVVLKSRFAGDNSTSGFALYFLAGMLPWLAFSEAAGRAPVVLHENVTLIKKVVFPLEILPVNTVIAGLVSEFFGLGLFLLALVLIRGSISHTVIWLPAILLPQLLFTTGISWFLSALGAFVRDLAQINGFLLTLWFFLTPICYPETQVPAAATPVLLHNPVFQMVRGYRAILLEKHAPGTHMLTELWIVAAVVFVLGYAFYNKLHDTFADVL